MSAQQLVAMQGVDAAYGAVLVLQGVSLSVHAGELWAVLGPNGAGKSALAKLLVGALPVLRGSLTVCGHDAASTKSEVLAKQVAWVPQTVADDSGFTALELVLMGRLPHLGKWGLAGADDVTRARAALEQFGVLSLEHRPLAEVSGGERRRVFLARALAQTPKLLVLDEPTAFLDVRHQIEALSVVHRQLSPTLGVVAVLHDVNIAARFATHALLLRDGRVQSSGPLAEVLTASALSNVYGTQMQLQSAWSPV